MTTFRCLYIDDDEYARTTTYPFTLKAAWKDLQINADLDVVAMDFREGQVELETRIDTYQLLVIDLLRDEKLVEAPGFAIMELARRSRPNLPIMALSGGGAKWRTKVEEMGLPFAEKDLVKDSEQWIAYLSRQIREAFLKAGQVLEPAKCSFEREEPDSLPLAALIEDVSDASLTFIAKKLLGRPLDRIVAGYVTAGRSGAAVVRLDCHSARTPVPVKLLVKLSRSRADLERELEKSIAARALWPDRFVPYEGVAVEESGWFAIQAPFRQKAQTLSSWLASGATSETAVEKTLSTVCIDGLAYGATASEIKDERVGAVLGRVLSSARKAAIKLAFAEFEDLAVAHDQKAVFSASLVRNFLLTGRVGNVDRELLVHGTWVVESHGDLHGRNVLVDSSDIPWLIDPALVGQSHWALDLARLLVDLVLHSLGTGRVSYEWNPATLVAWQAAANSVVDGQPAEYEGREYRHVVCAINWLRDHLWQIHTKVPQSAECEFKLALAVEFLRASTRSYLPAPKRVVGLLAACHALRAAGDAFESAGRVRSL